MMGSQQSDVQSSNRQIDIEANRAVVREFNRRVFNEHNADAAEDYLTTNAVWHGGTLGTVTGIRNIIVIYRGILKAVPDLVVSEQESIAERSTVAMRFVVEGTHAGEFFGVPPTGNRVRWDAVDVYRLENGRIAEEWAADDLTAILYQLGLHTPSWLRAIPPR